MFLCSQSFFSSLFYSWTFVKPEERGNLFSRNWGSITTRRYVLLATTSTHQVEGQSHVEEDVAGRLNKHGSKKTVSPHQEADKVTLAVFLCHHSQFQVLSQSQQAYCIFWLCFSKIFDSFYFLNNCECFSSFLSDISWQPKCFALDWSCLCQIQHFTHLHQSQRVDVALLYFAIFVA